MPTPDELRTMLAACEGKTCMNMFVAPEAVTASVKAAVPALRAIIAVLDVIHEPTPILLTRAHLLAAINHAWENTP